jgi:hypothetical protein
MEGELPIDQQQYGIRFFEYSISVCDDHHGAANLAQLV